MEEKKILPLEEAPFWRYLEIIREQGYEEDADLSETFYVELLTTVKHRGGEHYTKEQVMNAKFKNLVKASELILEHAQREIEEAPTSRIPLQGKVLAGKGADKLTEEAIRMLSERQAYYHEEEKLRLAFR